MVSVQPGRSYPGQQYQVTLALGSKCTYAVIGHDIVSKRERINSSSQPASAVPSNGWLVAAIEVNMVIQLSSSAIAKAIVRHKLLELSFTKNPCKQCGDNRARRCNGSTWGRRSPKERLRQSWKLKLELEGTGFYSIVLVEHKHYNIAHFLMNAVACHDG